MADVALPVKIRDGAGRAIVEDAQGWFVADCGSGEQGKEWAARIIAAVNAPTPAAASVEALAEVLWLHDTPDGTPRRVDDRYNWRLFSALSASEMQAAIEFGVEPHEPDYYRKLARAALQAIGGTKAFGATP